MESSCGVTTSAIPEGSSLGSRVDCLRGGKDRFVRPPGYVPGMTFNEATDATDNPTPQDDAAKDPDTWVTGDEPATGPQKSYVSTLAREAHRDVEVDLTKAEASKLIDELQSESGRGV